MDCANEFAPRLGQNHRLVAGAPRRRSGTPRNELHDMRFYPFPLALLLIACAVLLRAADSQGNSMSTTFVAPMPMDLPDYLRPATDPAFGTNFMRITKPGALGGGVVCGTKYCSHRYSSAQAWNADQSLLVLANGCNGLCSLDGKTYAPLFHRDKGGECEWHPRDADVMIC